MLYTWRLYMGIHIHNATHGMPNTLTHTHGMPKPLKNLWLGFSLSRNAFHRRAEHTICDIDGSATVRIVYVDSIDGGNEDEKVEKQTLS